MNEQKLIDALVDVENAILKKWRKEKPCILVGSNGGLIQLHSMTILNGMTNILNKK